MSCKDYISGCGAKNANTKTLLLSSRRKGNLLFGTEINIIMMLKGYTNEVSLINEKINSTEPGAVQ